MNLLSRSRVLRIVGWSLVIAAVLVVCVRLRMQETGEGGDRARPKNLEQSATSAGVQKPSLNGSTSTGGVAPAGLAAKSTLPSGPAPTAGLPGVDAPVVDARPFEKLLAGESFTLLDHGSAVAFELALDELYLPTAPVGKRLRQVERQADAAGLLRAAESLAAVESAVPNLVVYPARQRRNDSSRRIVTDGLLLRVSDPATAQQITDAADLRITSRPSYAPEYVVAEARNPGIASSLNAMSRLDGKQGIVSAAPMLARQETTKTTIPNDVLFSQQWHLQNTGQGGGSVGVDAAVTTVWDTYQGSGTTIAIVDNGVQLTHPDLAPNADSTHNYDWNDFPPDTDPTPNAANGDFHGTSVAGVAAARGGNVEGVSGVAPKATIVGFRLIAAPTTDQVEADAMTLHNEIIDIKNNSWGPVDGQPWILGTAGPLFLSSLANGVTTGRGGKGVIYVFAAGNGRADGDQGNKDGYANSIYALAVSALANTGVLSSYSETGSHIVVCAPSNGGTLGIVTTDLIGDFGYNTNGLVGNLADRDYTNSFGGTSAAAPVVSGVVALMLQANPNLNWRDVKEILLRSSTKISPTDPGWVSRVVGDKTLPPIKHNEKFGGGLINAQAAVTLAATWPVRGPMIQSSLSRTFGTPGILIPDNYPTGVQTSFDMSAKPPMGIEHVEVTLSASHTSRGDLQVTLTSPSGVVSTLAAATPYDYDFGATQHYSAWVFSSVRHWGESSVGVWKVTVADLAPGDIGYLEAVSVKFSGGAPPPQDIAVEQPAGTDLTSGTANVGFGSVATDDSGTKTFTVKNAGALVLSNIAASIDGTNATDFTMTSVPETSLVAGGSSTFDIRFAPATAGPKQATLHIVSDDPDESPFNITLSGTATPTVGFLAFTATAFTVNESDGTINIPITRTGGNFGSVAVSVSTTDGSALAGSDFTELLNDPVTIADGATSGSASVSIVNSGTSEVNETFIVTLSDPTNGARLGTPVTASVTIIDSSSLSQITDTVAPGTPVISSPTANILLGVAVGGTVGVTGTASDNKGVKQVLIALNGGPFTDAVLGTPGATNTTFSGMLPPATGTNTFQVKTVDYSGRVSTTATRIFRVSRPLAVNADSSLGSLTAGFSPTSFREVGQKFVISATPKPPTVTPPFAGAIFTGWTLGGVDVANGGIAFTPQRVGATAAALGKASLNFTFREGLVLTANFVLSPFTPTAGTYTGLVHASPTLPHRPVPQVDGSPRDNSTEGFLTATMTSGGAFSGAITIDGSALNIAGAFDLTGVARFGASRATVLTVARVNKPSLLVALNLDVNPARLKDTISGTVTSNSLQRSVVQAVSNVSADRAFYDGLTAPTTVPAAYLGTANATQAYTWVFQAKPPFATIDVGVDGSKDEITEHTQLVIGDRVAFADLTLTSLKGAQVFTVVDNDDASPADGIFKLHDSNDHVVNIVDTALGTFPLVLDPDNHQLEDGLTTREYPQGDGYGFLTLTKAGLATFTGGKLADGTAITGSGKLSKENKFPLFLQLYSKKGYLSGDVQLDSADLKSDLAALNLDWLRPFDATSQYYPYGWTNTIRVGLQGARYAASFTPASSVLRLPDGADSDLVGDPLMPANTVSGNAGLGYFEGQLNETLNRTINISTTNVVTKVPVSDTSFTLTLTAATGLFTGTFVHENDQGVAVPLTTAYEGVIYQKGAGSGGYGFFLTRKPAPIDYTGESGGVRLFGKP